MRYFQTLEHSSLDSTTGILSFTAGEDDALAPRLHLKREGEYIALSAGYAGIEIAMRLRHQELARTLAHLQPVDGLQATRQVGNGQVSIALGLQTDGTLLLRPMLVADSSGHISLNFQLTPASTRALTAWLGNAAG